MHAQLPSYRGSSLGIQNSQTTKAPSISAPQVHTGGGGLSRTWDLSHLLQDISFQRKSRRTPPQPCLYFRREEYDTIQKRLYTCSQSTVFPIFTAPHPCLNEVSLCPHSSLHQLTTSLRFPLHPLTLMDMRELGVICVLHWNSHISQLQQNLKGVFWHPKTSMFIVGVFSAYS